MRNDVITAKLLSYVEKLQAYCAGLTYEEFARDTKLAEACVFNLGQMGELSNRIDPEFAHCHPEIPWHQLYALRNRIVHDYEGVNLQLIWEIIAYDLEPLRQGLQNILG